MNSASSLLFGLLFSLLLLSARAQPPAPEGMPSLPGMGSDDDDAYTIYQMDGNVGGMLGYSGYDGFDVMGVDELGQLVSLGAKKGTFRMPQPLGEVEAAPKYEQLPTETMKTRYLKPVIRTTYAAQRHWHCATRTASVHKSCQPLTYLPCGVASASVTPTRTSSSPRR